MSQVDDLYVEIALAAKLEADAILTRLNCRDLIDLNEDQLDEAIAAQFGIPTKYEQGMLWSYKSKRAKGFTKWQPI